MLVVFSLWFIFMCFRTLNILLLLESVFFTLRYTWDVCMMCRDRNHWATHKQRMCVNRNKCEKCLNLNRDSCIDEHKVWNGQTKEIHTLSYNRYLKLNTWKLANCTQFIDSATRVRLINKLKIDDTPRLDFESFVGLFTKTMRFVPVSDKVKSKGGSWCDYYFRCEPLDW